MAERITFSQSQVRDLILTLFETIGEIEEGNEDQPTRRSDELRTWALWLEAKLTESEEGGS
jgi:hypothetical protein